MSDNATQSIDADVYGKYKWQIRKLKEALATAAKDRDAYKAEADQYRSDNVKIKEKWDESTVAQRLAAAEGKLREVEYRKTWDRVAKAKGIREDALDAAYQLGGYKPAEGEVDENVIGEAIEAQKKTQAFLVAPKGEATPPAPEKPPAKPAPGSGQGGKSSGSTTFILPDDTDGRWSDPVWQWNNQKEIAAAIKDKHAKGTV